MMSRPEVQAMISQQQKAAIDARYAPLFKSLNLPPEQVDKLKALLAERSTTMQDILTVPEDQIPTAKVLYTIVGGRVAYEGK